MRAFDITMKGNSEGLAFMPYEGNQPINCQVQEKFQSSEEYIIELS